MNIINNLEAKSKEGINSKYGKAYRYTGLLNSGAVISINPTYIKNIKVVNGDTDAERICVIL